MVVKSHQIVSSLLAHPIKTKKHNSPSLCALVDIDGLIFDEAVINFLFAPNTYTGENLVEINLHGNPVIIQKTIALCCSFGAEVALGGEFTKRAYINNKLDVSQVESVASLISSKSVLGVKLSYKNLRGSLFKNIMSVKNKIISGDEDVKFLGNDKEWLVQYCQKKLKEKHSDYFVFGHRHLPLDIALNDQSKYINLGDWIGYYTYAVFDGKKLELKELLCRRL